MLRHQEKKPLGGQLLTKHFGCRGDEIVVVGDRLLTDIVYGNRIGAYSIFCTEIISLKNDNKIARLIQRLLL